MIKKIILIFLFFNLLFAQTSRFEKTFRTSSGELLIGASIDIINQNTSEEYTLTEDAIKAGVYYHENVPYGHYKIYVNGVLRQQNYYFAAIRERTFIEAVDPDANNQIDTQGIENNAITTAKIEDNAITTAKIIDDAITGNKIANNAIIESLILDSTILKRDLSKILIDYIDASGGGTITNYPDGVTIQENVGDELYVDTSVIANYNRFSRDNVRYVSKRGNDSYDGRSEGTSKLTIASAITAVPAGGTILIDAGEYSESLTISKNLNLILNGAIITSTTTALDISDSVNIYGGELRVTAGSGPKIINVTTGAFVNIFSTKLHSDKESNFYYIYADGGHIEFNGEMSNSKYWGVIYGINNATIKIKGNQVLGYPYFNNSDVSIICNRWYQNAEIPASRGFFGDSKIYISVKEEWGETPESGNLDSLSEAKDMPVENTTELTIADGIFNTLLSPKNDVKIKIENCHNDYGKPSIRTNVAGTGDGWQQTWEFYNSKLKWIPFPWDQKTKHHQGNHIIERGNVTHSGDHFKIIIKDCDFEFGDPDVFDRDTSRVTGNIFALNFSNGDFILHNNFMLDWGQKGILQVYKYYSILRPKWKSELINNIFIRYLDTQYLWLIGFNAGEYFSVDSISLKMINNNLISGIEPTNSFIGFNTDNRQIAKADSMVFISGNKCAVLLDDKDSSPHLFRETIPVDNKYNNAVMDSLNVSQSQLMEGSGKFFGALYSRSFGDRYHDPVSTVSGWGYAFPFPDTLAKSGTDGDSLLITWHQKNPSENDAGTIVYYFHGMVDINFKMYVYQATSNFSWSSNNSIYDVNLSVSKFFNNAGTYAFQFDTLRGTANYHAIVEFVEFEDPNKIKMRVINTSPNALNVAIWLKQSLNINPIKTEFLKY